MSHSMEQNFGEPETHNITQSEEPLLRTYRSIKRIIDRVDPTLMIFSLVAGLCFSIGHHLYYQWLNGQTVGDSTRQQWALRFGNAFASLVSLCLKTAVGIAYLQEVWRTLKLKSFSLKTLDEAFELDQTLWPLLNWKLFCKMPTGVTIALILWVIPIAALFPAATLSTARTTSTSVASMTVPNFAITNHKLEELFIYEADNFSNVSGASPELARNVGAVAMTGQRTSFQAPTSQPNSSYHLQTYLPLLQCSPANSTVQSRMTQYLLGDVLSVSDKNVTLNNRTWSYTGLDGMGEIGFLALAPTMTSRASNHSWELEDDFNDVRAADVTGELWIALATCPGSTNDILMEFISCELYNASVSLDAISSNFAGTMTNIETEFVNLVNPAWSDFKLPNITYRAYAAYFYELASYYIGVVERSDSFGYNKTGLTQKTTLALASQFQQMNQRLLRNAGASVVSSNGPGVRSGSFADDIEAFSLNASLSMLSDPILCTHMDTDVTTTTAATVYLYEPTNLILSYGFALLFSTTSVLIGIVALRHNGISHDASVSTFAIAMQSDEIKDALGKHPLDSKPLGKELRQLKFQFDGEERFKLNR
ncbi:uncharacterized protein PAC_18426 [Phialocephala subalpina]|uniref:Uncharacterized protein n=1 Tax=Phialocephala subalpina TaxID=576137 RepID=A0A1L7XU73_9HELO|nr:uncharacterized protein PAC_18426 [Phialocephala subalpina]